MDGILACHGTPDDDFKTLLEEVTEHAVRRRTGEEVAAVMGALPAGVSIVLCGHSHVPGIVQVPGGPLVVNPGSIGLPAYRHNVPHPHRMESGSPHARYAVIQRHHGSWHVEWRAVVYDWDAAAARADEIGRADWAHALRTGHALPGAA
jgi:predicted phosphodiesterase